MMPATEGMTQMMPNHVLRVGQTIRLDSEQDMTRQHPTFMEPGNNHSDHELDVSLDNLNRLIMELDPTFEPIQLDKSPSCVSPPTDDSCSDEDVSHSVLIPRGCATSAADVPMSPSISIPTQGRQSCSPHGALVFSSSPSSLLPPLPCGSAPRRNPSPKSDMAFPHGPLRPSHSNRNSISSLHSDMSAGSDTSYVLGSNLSLASEEAESPESILTYMSGSFTDGPSRMRSCDNRPLLTKQGHLQELPAKGALSSPASLAGSWSDIPVLLVNGVPQPGPQIPPLGPEMELVETASASNSRPCPPHCSQVRFNGSQPSMKFVMDTSKFWFRPHISRAEAEVLVKDKEAGTFVVRDSTSYRGSFGLAMKVDPTSPSQPEQSRSELVRHFLIESSAKGVRIKGSAQEPYFGSLSALVYQHTISAYALPCRLLLLHSDISAAEEKGNEKVAGEDRFKAAANFVYLNAVPTEMLTGPCAVQRAVSSTLEKASGSFAPTLVNLKVSLKGVTLTDINRKLFFRRHYPAHLLSHGGVDPDNRAWVKGCGFSARLFGFVAKGTEAGVGNVCHVFAEYDPLQPYNKVIEVIQAAVAKPSAHKD